MGYVLNKFVVIDTQRLVDTGSEVTVGEDKAVIITISRIRSKNQIKTVIDAMNIHLILTIVKFAVKISALDALLRKHMKIS